MKSAKRAIWKTPPFSFLFIMVSLFACNDNDPEYPDRRPAEIEPDVYLTVVDSIGVEEGDSNYVLAMPSYATRLADGNTIVVDHMLSKVLVYREDGDFFSQVGRSGSGPGEYLLPSWVTARPSGGLAVIDAMQKRMLFYTDSLEYAGCTDAFSLAAPMETVFLNDTTFLAIHRIAEEEGGEIMAGFSLSMFNVTSTEPVVSYFRNLAPYDVSQPFSDVNMRPMFTMTQSGIVFISVRSQDDFVITACDLQGEELFRIEEPFTRIAKTEQEIEEETQRNRSFLRHSGAPEHVIESLITEPFYNAISSIGIGPDGNLWVCLGYYDSPVFKVYDPSDGSFLYNAALSNRERHGDLRIIVNRWGITALDQYCESWPRVYLIQADPASV